MIAVVYGVVGGGLMWRRASSSGKCRRATFAVGLHRTAIGFGSQSQGAGGSWALRILPAKLGRKGRGSWRHRERPNDQEAIPNAEKGACSLMPLARATGSSQLGRLDGHANPALPALARDRKLGGADGVPLREPRVRRSIQERRKGGPPAAAVERRTGAGDGSPSSRA
jgi:hypothetical protein